MAKRRRPSDSPPVRRLGAGLPDIRRVAGRGTEKLTTTCEEKLRAIEAYCREVDKFEDERGYDVRGIAHDIIDIIHAT